MSPKQQRKFRGVRRWQRRERDLGRWQREHLLELLANKNARVRLAPEGLAGT